MAQDPADTHCSLFPHLPHDIDYTPATSIFADPPDDDSLSQHMFCRDHGLNERVASLNCRGLASFSSRERLVHLMKKHGVDILCLQETKINLNATETHDVYEFLWSSDVKDTDRSKAESLKLSGKATRNNQEHGRIFRAAVEHLGVGFVIAKKVQKYLLDIRQESGRNALITLKTQSGVLDIISTYAPQACHRDADAASRHYAELESLLDIHYGYSPRLILGDFNARLIKALPHESDAVGPYTLGASEYELDFLSDAQLESRSKFVEFCLNRRFVVRNTFFQKPDGKLVTFKGAGVRMWQPPWQLHKYGQMDFLLVNDPWKNAVTDIYTTEVHAIDTDHKLLVSNVKFKLKAKKRNPTTTRLKFHKPSTQDIDGYNALVANSFRSTELQNGAPADLDEINKVLMASSKQTLPIRHPEQRKEYISQVTWNLLEQKWDAVANQGAALANSLSKEITDNVRKDKEQHLLDQLQTIDAQGYKWDDLKRLRAKFTPNFTKFKDAAGNHVPRSQYSHKAADYLENTQWKSPQNDVEEPSRQDSPLQDGRYVISSDPFTPEELDFVLKRLKNNKSPGDDGVPAELFKWLNEENRKIYLDAANACLQNEEMQAHHMNAVVVSIYKKGDSSSLANYRPISLLNSCYKILAALVKERLDIGLDTWISSTQYGFRKKRSTTQAIYIARRLQDLAEKSNTKSTLVLLDWEKAFDKISQVKMVETLYRLKVPTNLLNLIKSFYRDPQFRVSSGEETSTWRKQTTGIRQGCPLSPYLFTLVMGALFADVQAELNTPRQLEPIDGIHFSNVLFADDTLIFGANTRCVNVLLHSIERHSKYYGVKLNYDKCINLTANQKQSSIRFSADGPGEGKLVPRQHSATYLGCLLTDSFDNRAEVLNRLGDCTATCRRMKLFWNKAATSVKWKIQVFNAIIRSKLLYGLETIQLTNAEISKLNAFQNKSLRQILKKPPTYIDREQTNQRLYDEIQHDFGCKFENFGETWRKTKMKLFGHVLRCSRSDPLHQVTFAADGLLPRELGKKRPGRPKSDWLLESFKDAFKSIMGSDAEFDKNNMDHFRMVKDWAFHRAGPF